MSRVENIWCLDKDDAITVRKGIITLDNDDYPINEDDAQRAILVAKGLQPRDFAVTATRIGETTLADRVAGFFVTSVNKDGRGVIVHADKLLANPKDYVNSRVANLWRLLEAIDPDIYEEFSVQALGAYLHHMNQLR